MTNKMPQSSSRAPWKLLGAKNIKHAYEVYASNVPDPITKQEYRKVLYACNEELKKALLSGRKFKIPFLNGTLTIYKGESYQKGNYIDFEHYNKTGEKKIKLFGGTSGYVPRIKFERSKCNVRNNRIYGFQAARDVIRKANKLITGEDHIYFTEKLRYIPDGTK